MPSRMNADRLVGTWRIASMETRSQTGEVSQPFGTRPVGYLTYTTEGFVTVVMTSRERAGFASQEERATAAGTAFAYGGRYESDGDRIHHHVEVSLNPEMCGHTLTRLVDLAGDRLMLTAEGRGVSAVMIWERC